MLFNNIKIGDRLEITLLRDHDVGTSFVSQVEEILDENQKEILIHMPISYGQLIKLSKNEKYSTLFFTEKGMINFSAVVTGYRKESEFNFIVLKLTSAGERMQRRDFFRFTCLLPLKFTAISEEKPEEDATNEQMLDGIIKDIGGGGIRFVTNENLDEELNIKNVIMLGDACMILVGKLLHKQFFPKSNYKYQYRVEFVGIKQTEQEGIIQYIFNEQRKQIQRAQS